MSPWKRRFDRCEVDNHHKRRKIDGFRKFHERDVYKSGKRHRSSRTLWKYREEEERGEFNGSEQRFPLEVKPRVSVFKRLKGLPSVDEPESQDLREDETERGCLGIATNAADVLKERAVMNNLNHKRRNYRDHKLENYGSRSSLRRDLKNGGSRYQYHQGRKCRKYGPRDYPAPRSKFDHRARRLAPKDKSNNYVAENGGPEKRVALSGKSEGSSQHSRPSKEEIPSTREISLRNVVPQNFNSEPEPSISTGHDRFVENGAKISAVDEVKVLRNGLQEKALESPANYKRDRFIENKAWIRAVDETEVLKNRFQENAFKSHANYKGDRSIENETVISALDGIEVLKNGLQEKALKSPANGKGDALREFSNSRHSSDPVIGEIEYRGLDKAKSSCRIRGIATDVSVEPAQYRASVSSHAHSSVNGTHETSMDALHSHDQFKENSTEVQITTGTNKPKNTPEEYSSKCQQHSCEVVHLDDNSDSSPQAEEDNVSFSSMEEYNVLKHQDDEKTAKSPKGKRKGKIAEEMNAVIDLDYFIIDLTTPERVTDFETISGHYDHEAAFQNLFGDKIMEEYSMLKHQDDEKTMKSPKEKSKGKIAEEMNAVVDLDSSIIDLISPERVTDCEANSGHNDHEAAFQNLFGDKIMVVTKQGEAMESEHTVNKDEHRCFFYVPDSEVVDNYIQKSKQSKERIVLVSDRYNVQNSQKLVTQALKLFRDVYTIRMRVYKAERRNGCTLQKIDMRTATDLKSMQKWVNQERVFVGHVPGVEIGDQFRFRAELTIVGLHHKFVPGIDYVNIQGKNYAISIVDSGRYENQSRSPDSFVYVGHGGNSSVGGNEQADQELKLGNLAMKNSRDIGVPVRVIRSRHVLPDDSYSDAARTGNKRYIYEGLFVVTRYWQERAKNGKTAYMFELHRIPNQPSLTPQALSRPKRLETRHPSQEYYKKLRKILKTNSRNREVLKKSPKKSKKLKNSAPRLKVGNRVIVKDVSRGTENFPVRLFSDVYDVKLPEFTYTTNMTYPDWYHPSLPLGCSCANGCSDSGSGHCFCAVKNGGDIAFNQQGAIVRPSCIIHECGPACKCPPSCRNRVSQRGLRYHLEIFKKIPRGWGVRSRDYISSGSFICEFIGELLYENEKKIGHNKYIFDIGNGYKIDASRWGNVSRFINRGTSPNLRVQKVVYDDDFEIAPHIMLFAAKNIVPMQELCINH